MSPWFIAGAMLIAVAAYLLFSGYFSAWRTFRGTRVITCPENLEAAAVKVNAAHAAQWASIAGEPDLKLKSCTRWPEKAGCGQECLAQIERSPESCLVQTIVSDWYAGKACTFCEKPIGQIAWHERPPAVFVEGAGAAEWKDIAPEKLPAAFAHGKAVCWSCSVRENFLREHPGYAIERNVPVENVSNMLEPTASVY